MPPTTNAENTGISMINAVVNRPRHRSTAKIAAKYQIL